MTTNKALHVRLDAVHDAQRVARYIRNMAEAMTTTNALPPAVLAAKLEVIATVADRIATNVATLGE